MITMLFLFSLSLENNGLHTKLVALKNPIVEKPTQNNEKDAIL